MPTVGRISDGASVERAVSTNFDFSEVLRWNMFNADFLTISRVRDAINDRFPGMARIEDAVTLALMLPPGADTRATLMAEIEMLDITPAERAAKVIVNSRTGTIVISSAVRLAPAAVSHGSLVVRIDEDPTIVQPAPFSRGRTALEPNSNIEARQSGGYVTALPGGANLADVVDALNMLGASPADLVAILEALKQAGSLTAEVVII